MFNAVTVSLAPADEAVDGLRPVIVSVGDRPSHTIELSAGYTSGGYPTNEGITEVAYSTSEGAGIDAKWILYNRFGQADTTTFTGRLAQIQQKLDVETDLPDWGRPDQILKVGGDIYADDTTAFDDDGVGLRRHDRAALHADVVHRLRGDHRRGRHP